MSVLVIVAAACGSGEGETSESVETDGVATTDAAVETTTSEPPTTEPAATTVLETTTTVANGTCPPPVENTVTQAPGIVADLPDDDSGYIEGVVVDGSGNVFVSAIRTGELLKFAPGSSEPEVFGQIPDWIDDGIGFLGLAADSQGNIYGAVASETSAGIWKFDCATGEATRFAGTEEMVFADGVSVDEDGVVWASDAASGTDGTSGLGAAWRIDVDGVASKYYESPLLGNPDPDSEIPGLNGVFVRDDVFWGANTARGRVSSVPLLPDGTPGAETILANVAAPDGVTVAADGTVYATGVAQSEIVRIQPDGTVSRLASSPDVPLACPTSLFLGTGSTEQILYVANLVSLEGCGGVGPDLIAIDVDTAPWVTDDADSQSQAVFIVGDADAPDPQDEFLVAVAGGNNVIVTLLDDEQTASDAGREALLAADLVLISGSVTRSSLSPDLAQLPVPIGNFSGAASADLGLATVSGETNSGEAFIVMNPDTADHPLAGGVVDRAEVFTAPAATLNSGEVGGDAIVVATSPGTPSTPVYYAYEAGTTLADGTTAPARRVAAYPTLASLPTVSGVSATLFFATLDWLAARS
jgi:sugar lactone lactonase YvrE